MTKLWAIIGNSTAFNMFNMRKNPNSSNRHTRRGTIQMNELTENKYDGNDPTNTKYKFLNLS